MLILGNHSDSKISGTLSLFDAGGKQWTQQLVLGSHQTQRMATSDLLKKAGLSGSYGGISFVTDGPVASIDAAHFMYDEVSKFSSSQELMRRDPSATLRQYAGPEAKHWTMYAPMLALQHPDPAIGVPAGPELQPTLIIRNTTARKLNADLTLTWRGESGKGQVKLPQLRLAAFATQQYQIASMQGLLRIPDSARWGLVTLTTDAGPHDLVAIAASADPSGRYTLETRFTGGMAGHFTGGEWDVDANHNEIAAITNAGSKPTDALLTLHYDKGQKKYELQQRVASGDQMWVNLAQLVRSRVADRNGNTLPADLGSVTCELRDLSSGGHALMVSSLATDASYGFSVRTPTPSCCGYSGIVFDPDELDFLQQGQPDAIWVFGSDMCNDQLANVSGFFPDSGWGTQNTAVANLVYGKASPVGAGSTNGFANGDVPYGVGNFCPDQQWQPTAPISVSIKITSIDPDTIMIGSTNQQITINGYGFGSDPTVYLPAGFTSTGSVSQDTKIVLSGVNIPYSATIGNNNFTVTGPTGTSPAYGFTVNGPNKMVVQNDKIQSCIGVSYQCRIVSYTIKNYDGTLASNIPIAEDISFSGYNCNGSDSGHKWAHCDGTYSTDGGGNFSDQWSMYTGSTPAGCGINVTDHWQWCGPTGNNPNPGITFGTLVGWSHTSSVNINGYINPPTTIPTGTIFAP